ncbi:MAG: hypothetical protein J6S63_08445, partial [Atopobiaceae bacterium]|nr:hypothetical protein [Atopobiaceae bacterium]
VTVTDGAVTKTVVAPLVKEIVVGSGSKGVATFDGLSVSTTYRAYELADSAKAARTDYTLAEDFVMGSTRLTAGSTFRAYGVASGGSPITYAIEGTGKLYSQTEDKTGGSGAKINGYVWGVSETGTYYTVDGGARVKNDVTSIAQDNDEGVTITNNAADAATRAGYLDVTNNKTETGSITVNKTMLLNGQEDTSNYVRTIHVGLYRKATETEIADNNVTKLILGDGSKVVHVRDEAITLAAGSGKGSATFSDLAFGTYYVFELAPTTKNGPEVVNIGGTNYEPVTGSTAQLTFNNGTGDVTREYIVSADDKPQELSHDRREVALGITNAYNQRGSLKFVKVDKDTWDSSNANNATKLAGAAFTLTRLNTAESTADEPAQYNDAFTDSGAHNYMTVGPNKVQKTSVLTNTAGEATLVDLADGVYEGRESTAPNGYLLVGDGTFYVEVKTGQATFLKKEGTGASATLTRMDGSDITGYVPGESNVLAYKAETRSGSEVTAPAVITIGDTAGTELPSTGGPGIAATTALGCALLAAALALARRRSARMG